MEELMIQFVSVFGFAVGIGIAIDLLLYGVSKAFGLLKL